MQKHITLVVSLPWWKKKRKEKKAKYTFSQTNSVYFYCVHDNNLLTNIFAVFTFYYSS